MVQGLLVDLDGTLADSIFTLKQVFVGFLASHQIEGSEEEFNSYLGTPLPEVVRSLRKKYSLKDAYDTLYNQYISEVLHAYTRAVKPMPHAVETLRLFKKGGGRLALVTAASKPVVMAFLASNNLMDLFDALICAGSNDPGKPDPALYLRALSSLQLDAGETIAIEDSLSGVESALGAGCQVFWLTAEERPHRSDRVRQVGSWLEIRREFEGR